MPTFSYDSVETLDYDFTGVPSNSGSGNCRGKGTIPEPSQDRLEAYAAAMRELFKVSDDKDVAKAMDEVEAEVKAKSDKLLGLVAELCQDSPSREEIAELPPRIQKAFLAHIHRELADPKLSTRGTGA